MAHLLLEGYSFLILPQQCHQVGTGLEGQLKCLNSNHHIKPTPSPFWGWDTGCSRNFKYVWVLDLVLRAFNPSSTQIRGQSNLFEASLFVLLTDTLCVFGLKINKSVVNDIRFLKEKDI